jgi:DNA-binding CsgD family transcriptional regulator
VRTGDASRAAAVSAGAAGLAETADATRPQIVADHCAALVAGDDERLAACASAYRDCELLYDAGLAWSDVAAATSSRDRSAAARAEAQSLLDGLGAQPPDLGPVAEAAERSRRWQPARASFGWESLTRAERRVLALLAAGSPNPDIAERLSLSKRTVESHVSRMYVKLAVTTRVELARLAFEHGIA